MTMSYCSLLAAADSHRDWAHRRSSRTSCALESPSGDVAALNRCGAALAHHMAALGGRVTPIAAPAPATTFAPSSGRATRRCWCWATSTPCGRSVSSSACRCAARTAGSTGPGTFDMKAGIAQALLAVRALADTRPAPPHRVVMLWTTDEEVGSTTSRGLIEAEARRSRAVLVLEPSLPGGAVKTARKGVGDFHLTATGIAAHAGVDPSRGASAIHELAWQVTQLAELTDLDRGRHGERRHHPRRQPRQRGRRLAPRRSSMSGSRRWLTAERVAAAIAQLVPRDPRVRLDVTGGIDRPPLERTAQVAALFDLASAIAAEIGRTLGRRRHRRRVGRKLHGRAWHPNIRRTGRGGRRRPCASRARAGRVARLPGRVRGRPDPQRKIERRCARCSVLSVRPVRSRSLSR